MTEAPDPAVAEVPVPLDEALQRLQLDGAIFFRSEFTEAWSFSSTEAAGDFAHAVEPHADRLIMFHIVAKGSCWVAGDDEFGEVETGSDMRALRLVGWRRL